MYDFSATSAMKDANVQLYSMIGGDKLYELYTLVCMAGHKGILKDLNHRFSASSDLSVNIPFGKFVSIDDS